MQQGNQSNTPLVNLIGSQKTAGRLYDLVVGQGVHTAKVQVKRCSEESYRALVIRDEDFSPALTKLEKLAIDSGIRSASDLCNRGEAALALATMALEYSGGGARAAAELLLAMEYADCKFDFLELVNFDSGNRRLANILMMGVRGSDFLPSEWITSDTGSDGQKVMWQLRESHIGEEVSS